MNTPLLTVPSDIRELLDSEATRINREEFIGNDRSCLQS